MSDPVYTINIFFIPLIAMYVYKKRNSGFRFSFETVCQYAITTVIMLLAVKIPLKVMGLNIHANESAYTLVAVAAAVILPLVWEIIVKNTKITLSTEQEIK